MLCLKFAAPRFAEGNENLFAVWQTLSQPGRSLLYQGLLKGQIEVHGKFTKRCHKQGERLLQGMEIALKFIKRCHN
jgi:hypothetical protein